MRWLLRLRSIKVGIITALQKKSVVKQIVLPLWIGRISCQRLLLNLPWRVWFCIEWFCHSVWRTLVIEVQNLIIMFIECCGDNIERMQSCFFHLVIPACHGKPGSILDGVLGKYHAQRMAQSIYTVLMSGYSSNRIAARCLWRALQLFADLKSRYLERANNSLRVSPVLETKRLVCLSVKLGIFHLVVWLQYGVPTMLDAQFLYGFAG